jgi:hypothetical protein
MKTIKLTQNQLNKIAELTDDNQHGEALQYIAKITHLDYYVRIFKSVNALHNIEGSMPEDLRAYRSRHRDAMFSYIKSEYGEDIFTLIYSQL